MSELSNKELETEKAYKQNKLQLEGINDKTDVMIAILKKQRKDLHF